MENNKYLAIVDTIEEANNHPQAILASDLGAPDPEKFYAGLQKFFTRPPNQQYLYSWKLCLSDKNLELITRKYFQEVYASFGSYRDSLMGLENQFKNAAFIIKNHSRFIAEVSNPSRCYIVGAGPSLDLLIKDLKNAHDERMGFLIAVDAAYRKLLDNHIIPDLVVTSERVDDTAPFFNKCSYEVAVLANIVTHPKTITTMELNGRAPCFYTRSFPEMDWLELGIDPLITTPFVTQTAVSFAIRMRFKEIILVGQDFAFGPNGESHAKIGHEHVEKIETQGIEVESVTGGTVMTSFHLNMFAEDLERLIRQVKHVQFYNTSPFGRKIEGAHPINLNAVGYRPAAPMEILTYPIPVRPDYLKEKAKVALAELDRLKNLDPANLEAYPHFSELGYSFMIQPFVVYLSQTYMEPEKEAEYLAVFRATAEQVRKDLKRILEGFLDELN